MTLVKVDADKKKNNKGTYMVSCIVLMNRMIAHHSWISRQGMLPRQHLFNVHDDCDE